MGWVRTVNSREIGSEHIVEISDYTSDGGGVARLTDGRVVFVDGAVRGDTCGIAVTKSSQRIHRAVITGLTTPSEHRIDPDCPAFGECGGCDYRHITYAEELYAKRKRVNDALRRIGGFNIECEDILTTGEISGYRNKAQIQLAAENGSIISGFYRPKTHEVVAADRCALIPNSANNAVQCVKDWMERYGVPAYDEDAGTGLVSQVYVRTGDGGMTVCLAVNGGGIPERDELLTILRGKCPELTGLLLNVNERSRGGTALNGRFITLWGDAFIDDSLGSLRFRLSPASFYQVNPDAALLLYGKAREYAALTGTETLLDLYCGTGTTTLFLARDAAKAIGVDVVPAAIRNAKENAEVNGIRNAQFIETDAAKLDVSGFPPPDCVTVDPPRKGLTSEVIRMIRDMSPSRIVYISCNPATLARDLKLLDAYEPSRVCAVDMFPRTRHVECVSLLSRK